MKVLMLAALLLATINTVEAQPELGTAVNNPTFMRAMRPLLACAEAVTRDNYFYPKDEKRIFSLVRDSCSHQIDRAEDACGLVTDYSDDDCETIIDNLLTREYKEIVRDILKDD